MNDFLEAKRERDYEVFNILLAEPLVAAGRTVLGKNFPLGEGWYRLNLRFNISVTIGTGAGAIADGELNFIKNILLRTSQGEVLVNLPARALFRIATIKSGAVPRKDAVAAATAVYRVDLPIFFTDNTLMRPEDTILDTYRYSALTLDIITGSVADLFTTVGTATATATIDAEVERTKGQLPPEALPIYHITYDAASPTDAASNPVIDLERSSDLAYKRFYVHASANGTAGVIYSGTAADDVQERESIVDQSGFIVQERVHEMIQNSNKNDYGLEAIPAGFTVFDFVKDGSLNTAIVSGEKSRLQYKWNNKAGVAANDIVSLAYEGVRTLKS